MLYSFGPLIAFTIVHFNVIMCIRRRNRLINKRNADYAFQQGSFGVSCAGKLSSEMRWASPTVG